MNPHKRDPAALAQPNLSQAPFQAGSNGSPLDAPGEEGSNEELNYDPVPPQKTVTVSVRYRIGGRGRPLPYPLDEEEGA
jgi:hypothetical protein